MLLAIGFEGIDQLASIITLVLLISGGLIGLWNYLNGGFTRQAYESIQAVPDIVEKQDEMCERQRDLSAGVYLLVVSRKRDGVDVDEDALLERLDSTYFNRYVKYTDGGERPNDD